jgi:hypothetical protein
MKVMSVLDLGKQMGSVSKAKKVLSHYHIAVVKDYFDHDRLKSLMAEPAGVFSNKIKWGIDPTSGIGAVKACLDAANLRLTAHKYVGVNYITVAGPRADKRQFAKLYCTAKMHGDPRNHSVFTLANFAAEQATDYYAMCCFEEPAMWAIPTEYLFDKWTMLKRKGRKALTWDDAGFRIPPQGFEHPLGFLQCDLSTTGRFALNSPEKLGLK